MKMMRCKAEIDVRTNDGSVLLSLGPGMEVDFDREVKPGFTVANAVAGKEAEWFEPVDAEPVDIAPVEAEPAVPSESSPSRRRIQPAR